MDVSDCFYVCVCNHDMIFIGLCVKEKQYASTQKAPQRSIWEAVCITSVVLISADDLKPCLVKFCLVHGASLNVFAPG